MIARDLERPIGITASLFGQLYFTELPTPGVSGPDGGTNTVNQLRANRRVRVLTEGEPEPTNLSANLFGDIYWTCTSAGVIVRLSRGEVEVIAQDLNRPYGLASDLLGSLYFTEVPTPGVGGADGGQNRVSKLNVGTGEITVIDVGDPDPIDVTVEPFGTTVYWTCRSAGVIVEAKLQRRRRDHLAREGNGGSPIETSSLPICCCAKRLRACRCLPACHS